MVHNRPEDESVDQGQDFLRRAYALSGASSAKELYDVWALRYDGNLRDLNYESPQRAVDALVSTVSKTHLSSKAGKFEILDAGCGTGQVGSCLMQSSLGLKCVVDGLDISPGMLAVARDKQIYRNLMAGDLCERIDRPDESYDFVLCVGTLTKGHVGPDAVKELVRVTKKAGLLVATVHAEIWEVEITWAKCKGWKEKVRYS